jgi:hypothetical protein
VQQALPFDFTFNENNKLGSDPVFILQPWQKMRKKTGQTPFDFAFKENMVKKMATRG